MDMVNTKNLASYLYLLICQRPQLIVFPWSRCSSAIHAAKAIFCLRKQSVLGNFTKIDFKLSKEPQIHIKQGIHSMKPEVPNVVCKYFLPTPPPSLL